MKKKNPAAVLLGTKGGTATKERHGSKHYSKIGKLGRQKQLATPPVER